MMIHCKLLDLLIGGWWIDRGDESLCTIS